MLPRFSSLAAGALGLCLACPALAQEPARLGSIRDAVPAVSANQKTAEVIADNLRLSGQLHRYSIDVSFDGGTAELTGVVADQSQSDEAIRTVQGVPGVERVVNHLTLANKNPIRRVQAAEPPAQPAEDGPRVAPGGPIPEPRPVLQGPPPGPNDANPPRMPPYAWPTYAPYNNYSRVAYPTAYPYQQWPFIGPVYPFPKVPLGWRSVKLEFEDGKWWFSKTSNMHDYWRIRYW